MAKRLNALLPVVRWAVIGLAGAILMISIIGLFRFPEYAARHLDEFTPNDRWTGAQVQLGLAELGWSPLVTAWFELGRNLLGLVLIYAISAAILLIKSHDWFGLFLMTVFIITSPVSGVLFKPVIEIWPVLNILEKIFGAIGWQLFFLLFFFFPNGRPVPSWAGWFTAGYSVFMLTTLLIEKLNNNPVAVLFSTLMVVIAIGSQIYRYFRRSDAVQRQQTKWIVFVLGFFLLLLPLLLLAGFQAPPAGNLGSALIKDYSFLILFSLVFWLTPTAIAIAVLRYRLWDIDLIIRRTLVYAALTASLGLVYFGSVLVLTQVFRAFSGQDSPVAEVLSTLAIFILFTPLRRRIQAVIDRRFYRQKYDAEQAVAKFAAAVRSETALNAITGQMVSVVEETVQPEAISLWLRKDR
jgi:hypothetical protein